MSATSFEDDLDDVIRGPAPGDARDSLVYWRERLERLPRRRRTARREARAMVVSWEQRVRTAEIERWGGGVLGRVAGTFAVLRTVPVRSLAQRAVGLVPRRLLVGTIAVVVGSALLFGVLIGAVLAALL